MCKERSEIVHHQIKIAGHGIRDLETRNFFSNDIPFTFRKAMMKTDRPARQRRWKKQWQGYLACEGKCNQSNSWMVLIGPLSPSPRTTSHFARLLPKANPRWIFFGLLLKVN
jgi:hypothetical protein